MWQYNTGHLTLPYRGEWNSKQRNITKHETTSILPILDSSKEMVVEAFPKALTAVTLTLYGKLEKTSGKCTRQRFLWSGSFCTSSERWLCLERKTNLKGWRRESKRDWDWLLFNVVCFLPERSTLYAGLEMEKESRKVVKHFTSLFYNLHVIYQSWNIILIPH